MSGMVTVNGTSMQVSPNYVGGWAGPGTVSTGATFTGGKWNLSAVTAGDTSIYTTGLTTVRYRLNSPTATANTSDMSYMTNLILNSNHPQTVQVGLADGSVRAMQDSLDMAALLRLCWIQDGEVVDVE